MGSKRQRRAPAQQTEHGLDMSVRSFVRLVQNGLPVDDSGRLTVSEAKLAGLIRQAARKGPECMYAAALLMYLSHRTGIQSEAGNALRSWTASPENRADEASIIPVQLFMHLQKHAVEDRGAAELLDIWSACTASDARRESPRGRRHSYQPIGFHEHGLMRMALAGDRDAVEIMRMLAIRGYPRGMVFESSGWMRSSAGAVADSARYLGSFGGDWLGITRDTEGLRLTSRAREIVRLGCEQGDQQSLRAMLIDEFADEHYDDEVLSVIERTVSRMLGGASEHHAREDVSSTAYRQVMQAVRRKRLRDPKKLSKYVASVAKNAVYEHFRQVVSERRHLRSIPEARTVEAPADADSLVDSERRQLVERIYRSELSGRDWELIMLRYGRGYTHKRIAQLMGMSRAAVSKALSHAIRNVRSRVKQVLAPDGEGLTND
ncbi:MAG: sigma-70 family RNA polymerase sigma factor [Planctomycetota bacterium]